MIDVKVLRRNTPQPLVIATPNMAEIDFQLRSRRHEGGAREPHAQILQNFHYLNPVILCDVYVRCLCSP